MSRIKFSHEYPKLWGQNKAELICVREFLPDWINKDIIEYDTKTSDGTYYKLPNQKMIQLIFIGNKGIPFCTLRRYTPDKFEYYKSQRCSVFDIIIEVDDK